MKSHARVVVIGGGVVGARVLYHLTKAGWKDVVLIERESSPRARPGTRPGGMHTLNGDPNVAKLQAIHDQPLQGDRGDLRPVLRHAPHRRADARRHARAHGLAEDGPCRGRAISACEHGDDLRRGGAQALPADGRELFRRRALRPDRRATSIPPGVTHAYAKSARSSAGRRSILHTRVDGLVASAPDGTWDVITEQGQRRTPSMSSMPAGCGRARSAAWSGSSCRCSPWSTSTSSPRRCRRSSSSARKRDAARHRLRGRDLHAPGARRHAARHL